MFYERKEKVEGIICLRKSRVGVGTVKHITTLEKLLKRGIRL